MNAIRKKDGFFIGLSEYVYDRDGNEYTWDEIDLVLNGKLQSQVEDENRTELRERYAGMAMQAIVSDHQAMKRITEILGDTSDENALQKEVANRSVTFADALINELKKTNNEE